MLDPMPTSQGTWNGPLTQTISQIGDADWVELSWTPANSKLEMITPVEMTTQSLEETQAMVLAQQFDQDILGDLGGAVRHFIDSGQVWALLIGVILGYLIRGLTSY